MVMHAKKYAITENVDPACRRFKSLAVVVGRLPILFVIKALRSRHLVPEYADRLLTAVGMSAGIDVALGRRRRVKDKRLSGNIVL